MGAGCSSENSVDSLSNKPQAPDSHAAGGGGGKTNNKDHVAKDSWKAILSRIADMELWSGSRECRPRWREYLDRANQLLLEDRRELPQDIVMKVMEGDFGGIEDSALPHTKSKILFFVSSTFTDTKAERNHLMRDVYPYLRTLCRVLGLDFGTVDMRWGVREEATMEHETTAMCLNEVHRCNRESAGPSFLVILGDKYGYRPLPQSIPQEEYNKIIQATENNGAIDAMYALDENSVPPMYVLKRIDNENADWWSDAQKCQEELRKVVTDTLGEDTAEKYFVSITETEIQHGLKDGNNRVVVMERLLGNIRQQRHLHRHVLDMKDGAVDEIAQQQLKQLKDEKIQKALDDADVVLLFDYSKDKDKEVKEYVSKSCDAICEKLAESILTNYREKLHLAEDPVYNDVIQHRTFALEKSSLFVGRTKLLGDIVTKATDLSRTKPVVVHGQSGCGKTALVAVAAREVCQQVPASTVVVRFLGTTTDSGTARGTLYSVCRQIVRAYRGDEAGVPRGYKELIPYFWDCLQLATADKPLFVFLDSLDQLSNEDFGRNLKWLSLKEDLPPHASVIVSTLPGQCLTVLQGHTPSENLAEVTSLTTGDGPAILDQMMTTRGRTVTEEQRKIILEAFTQCPLPLYLRIAADIAFKWHSYDQIDSAVMKPDMPSLISTLFLRLEARYGRVFVQHALGYITASRNGLSVTELEDVLSCDDDVLDEIFSHWTPPFRRIPQLLWVRVRNDLGQYLVERGTDGVTALNWYHRQFWETAEKRYLDDNSEKSDSSSSFRFKAHRAIADYFEGKWIHGKSYKGKNEDRQVPSQPIVLSGSRETVRQLNRRKLSELPYHYIKLRAEEEISRNVACLEFVEAKFEANQGYECHMELMEAARTMDNPNLKSVSKFVGAYLSHLLREPFCVYQLAMQQPSSHPMKQQLDRYLPEQEKEGLVLNLVENMDGVEEVQDPCEVTIQGHTSGVRCCQYSPSGDLIVSTAEDATLRIWDSFSGAELVTVTGLPGALYPGLADPYHGERPCCFSPDGRLIATGTEDGSLLVFDTNGTQIHHGTPHAGTVTGISFLNDTVCVTVCKQDGSIKAWSVPEFKELATVDSGAEPLGCTTSPDGKLLAVSCQAGYGLVLVSTVTWKVTAQAAGRTSMNLCVAWRPDGHQVATGGDNSAVTLWSPEPAAPTGQLTGHKGWIWNLQYSCNGKHLFTCSSDRTLRVWDVSSGTCVTTLGGHQHRVTWVSLKPPTHSRQHKQQGTGQHQLFVTASLDSSLKVWDYEGVIGGKVPTVGGLHHTVLTVSHNFKLMALCQGWSRCCTLVDGASRATLGNTENHRGNILAAQFNANADKLAQVDTGHTGAYEEGAERHASVIVYDVRSLPDMTPTRLDFTSPQYLTWARNFLLVGGQKEISLYHGESLEKLEVTGDQSWCDYSKWGTIKTATCSVLDDTIAVSASKNIHVYTTCLSTDGRAAADIKLVATLDVPDVKVTVMALAGPHLVAAGEGSHILVWKKSAESEYELTNKLTGHPAKVSYLVFSQSGQYLATTGPEGSLRIWNSTHGFTLYGVYYGPVNKMGFLGEKRESPEFVVGEANGNRKYLRVVPKWMYCTKNCGLI